MPKIAKQYINVSSESGVRYDNSIDASVNSDGEFFLTIPSELLDVTKSIFSDKEFMRGRQLWLTDVKGVDKIRTKILEHGLSLLRKAALNHISESIVTERMIIYTVNIQMSFGINSKGEIEPNAEHGEWWAAKFNKKRFRASYKALEDYSVGLSAEVWDRVTFICPSGNTVKWTAVYGNDEGTDAVTRQLNSFTGITLNPNDSSNESFQIMPYTPKAAQFFLTMMLGICKIGRVLDEFFGDENKVRLAIENPKLGLPLN